MQNIIIDKPYRFVPPKHGNFWPMLFRHYLPTYLNKSHGIESYELLGTDRLKASLDAGHGIMLAPNHCRPCDPMVLGLLAGVFHRPIYIVASWHLFMQNRYQTWLLPRIGVFSIYREGMDREALKCSIQILTDARRPLVLFPEGFITRTNDRLNHLFVLRQVCQAVCALPTPPDVIFRYPGFPSLLVTYSVGNDFFFSGHTAIATVGAITIAQMCPLWLGIAAGFVALLEAIVVLVLRAHYTMDIFGAVCAAWCAVTLAGWLCG